MRILHIVHQYLPDKIGGTELYTRTLAESLVARKHSVAIVTLSPTSASHEPTIENGVRIYRIPVSERSATAVFLSTYHHSSITHEFQHILQKEQPDIIHIQHLMGWPVSVISVIKAAEIPYIITLHDYWYLCANAQLITNYDETICDGPDKWVNCARCALARSGHENEKIAIPGLIPLFAYRQSRLKAVLKTARCLITPTHFTKQIYKQMGIDNKKMQVIPHGIHLPEAMPSRQEHEDFRIGYIGGISWQKGVHILIEAVNNLPHENVSLSIIGDMDVFPEYSAHLQTLADHPGTKFQGRLPHEQLWQALANMDILVVSSLWYETAALVIQEAFAAGVPVIASEIGALQERLVDGVNGRFVPPGNVSALTNTLFELYQQPEQITQLQQGIQPVRTIDDHIQDIETIYLRNRRE